ncbi:MAG: hypothetical protein P8046_03895 [Anaerolineales bacterium]
MDHQENSQYSQNTYTVLTTEHSALASARALINNEIFTRVTLYFTVLSSILIAAAFIAQIDRSSRYFSLFMWIALPLLILLGLLTFSRVVVLGGMEVAFIRAMNRIRHFYVVSTPETEKFLLFPPYDDDESVFIFGGFSFNFAGNLLSTGTTINFTNSLLITVSIGLLLNTYYGFQLNSYLPISILIFFLSGMIHSFLGVSLGKKASRTEALTSQFPPPSQDENSTGSVPE